MNHAGPSHGGHADAHGTHGTSASPHTLFPAEEWRMFQTVDRQAARNIVILLTAVFTVGLILYTCIALIVAR